MHLKDIETVLEAMREDKVMHQAKLVNNPYHSSYADHMEAVRLLNNEIGRMRAFLNNYDVEINLEVENMRLRNFKAKAIALNLMEKGDVKKG